MRHAAHDFIVDAVCDELLGSNFVERKHRRPATPSNVTRCSKPNPYRTRSWQKNRVVVDIPLVPVEHPQRKLVKHRG